MRLSVVQYWVAMLLVGGLGYGAVLVAPAVPAALVVPFAVVAVVLVLGLFVAASRARFEDLGYDPDDALVALVPVANIWVVLRSLFSITPSTAVREKRIAQWQRYQGPGRVGALRAVQLGLATWARALPVFIPVALVAGALFGWLDHGVEGFLDWLKNGDPAQVEGAYQGALIACAFLGVFIVIQAFRRGSVSRASWIPALFLVPTGLAALATALRSSRDLGMAVQSLPYEGLYLLFSAIVGGALAGVWVTIADRLDQGDSLGDATSNGLAQWRERMFDVIAVHGGAMTAIWVGKQVILPGVHYAVTYAFVDIAAIKHPEKAAFAWSTDVARGIRTRVFMTQFLAFLLYLVPALGLTAYSCGLDVNAWVTAFMDPSTVPWWQSAINETIWLLAAALIKCSLVHLYRDRVARLTAPEAAAPKADVPVTTNPFAPPSGTTGVSG